MHPSKRRRRNAATSTLAKPFRSPLHVDPNRTSNVSSEKQASDTDEEPRLTDTNATLLDEVQATSLPARPNLPSALHRVFQPALPSPIKPLQQHQSHRAHDSAYVSLQKHHSALNLQLKHLNASLDTAKQALSYCSTSTDADLSALTVKWRDVVRECSEELFVTAVDRVNRMGGVTAWQEKFRRQSQDASSSWYFDRDTQLDEEDLTGEQREQLEYLRDEAKKEEEKYGLKESKKNTREEEEDSFTMDMMLRQLNIDLDLVGYDKQAQSWIE